MSSSKPLDFAPALRVFLVANTPAFLYKQLRQLELVQRMSRELTCDQLMRIYNDASAKSACTGEEAALGYAALVAVTLKDFEEARRSLELLRSADLEWGPSMIQFFLSRPVSFTSTTVDRETVPAQSLETSLTALTSTSASVAYAKGASK